MKILTLDLLRWGPFSDLHLDFSAPARALHVVVGSNEAGKSTTLRAITGLFFGIPDRTTDDHRHKKDELRLGAKIAAEDGSELSFIRRKGRKNTLKDSNDQVIDEDRLRKFLGNLDEAQFKMMFGLSHERLIEGGHALVQGKGDLGESLFGAGLGQSGMSALLQKLGKRAEEIFTPQARTRKLNVAIGKFKKAKEDQKEASKSMRAWEDLSKQKTALEVKKRSLVAEIESLGREQRRLQRVKRALRPIAERAEILATLEQRREDVILPDSSAEDRRSAEKNIREAGPRQEQLEADIVEIETKIAALAIPDKLLDKSTSIRQLAEDLGSHRKALAEAAQLRTALEHIEEDIRAKCKRLQRDPADYLQGKDSSASVSVALEKRVRSLIKQRVEIDARIREASKTLHAAEEKHAAEQRRGDTLPVPASVQRLNEALDAARREGDLDKRIRDWSKDTEQLGQRVRARYASLELYGFSFDRIGTLPMPSRETIERFERELAAKDEELRNGDRIVAEKQRGFSKLTGDIALATRGGDVPTALDLETARKNRQSVWSNLRRNLFASPPPDSTGDAATFRASAMMQHFELLSDYEAAVRHADEMADRMFREADRVARISELSLQKEQIAHEITALEHRRTVFQDERNEIWTRWVDVWKPSDIKPLSPPEMKDFLGVYERLSDDFFRFRESESVLLADQQRAAKHAEALALALGDESASEGLARLVERAAAACDREARAHKERDAHVRDLEKAAAEVLERRRIVDREKAEIGHWAVLWEKALVELGLPLETGPLEVEEMLTVLAELGKRVQDAQDKRRRLAAMEREEISFRERTIEIAQPSSEALEQSTIERLAAAVVDEFRNAERDAGVRRGLLVQLEDKRRELADLGLRRRAAQSELEALCLSARVAAPADLPGAEERSKQIRELRSALETLERQLLDVGEGLTLDALVAECSGLSGDQVADELRVLQDKLAAANDQKGAADHELGGLTQQLALVDGSARAAEAAEEAEQHLASMAILVEEYARAKLAHKLLDDEIRQYREKNQGPIVRRASELFERLTLGSFIGIRGDNEGDEGKPVLECVRPGGMLVTVDGLSDGTRDQLFLALRIASLERHFENNEPIPFILDDILVNFDDARSRASLAALGELSRKTQVLFFTHHARVAELAADVVSGAELRVHDLNELSKQARLRAPEQV